jgi:hypothetical protein
MFLGRGAQGRKERGLGSGVVLSGSLVVFASVPEAAVLASTFVAAHVPRANNSIPWEPKWAQRSPPLSPLVFIPF